MSSALLTIKITAAGADRFQVESKVDGRATVKRTVYERALGSFLGSLADLAISTHNSRPPRANIESPFEEVTHG